MALSRSFVKVLAPVWAVQQVGDSDHRGELVRVRLTEIDLARVSQIQKHYERVGLVSSLQQVLSDAVGSFYDDLVEEGVVTPNL